MSTASSSESGFSSVAQLIDSSLGTAPLTDQIRPAAGITDRHRRNTPAGRPF
jgi:hypothetical protein